MKIEEGMYVRTDEGEISKIEWITFQRWEGLDNTVEASFWLENKERLAYPRDNFKASHNIIDLIEEDDLIKCQFGEQTLILQVGARYTTSYPENGFVKGVFTPDNEFWSLEVLVEEDILQSIVTKEQFSSMEYKVC